MGRQDIVNNLFTTILGSLLHEPHEIGAVIENDTNYILYKIDHIHAHHGEYIENQNAPGRIEAVNDKDDDQTHPDIVTVALKAKVHGPGGAAEALFGYHFKRGPRGDLSAQTYQLCFYLKHGHNREAGAALWKKGETVDGENYDNKIGNTATYMIRTIQDQKPQTAYCKNGSSATLKYDGFVVKINSGQDTQIIFREE